VGHRGDQDGQQPPGPQRFANWTTAEFQKQEQAAPKEKPPSKVMVEHRRRAPPGGNKHADPEPQPVDAPSGDARSSSRRRSPRRLSPQWNVRTTSAPRRRNGRNTFSSEPFAHGSLTEAELPPKAKARLCVSGQLDPDLQNDMSVDAPTAGRQSILAYSLRSSG